MLPNASASNNLAYLILGIIFLLVHHAPTNTAEAVPNPFSPRNENNIGKLPEVPSSLLKLHQIYISHPPHDTALYQRLRVSPNATTAEIQKSYRKLSRQYHPDKQKRRPSYTQQECAKELERIQQAYQILKEDATRLPYHKYGLQDLSTAVLILTGYQNSPKIPTPEEIELLHLMGFHHHHHQQQYPPPPPPRLGQEPQQSTNEKQTLQERIAFLAATILERIRPLVEGTLSERTVADFVATECDRLKKLPLGAHILRCVGRAYRHAGQLYLKQLSSNNMLLPIRDHWHNAKHVWTAAVASGRVALKENWLLKNTPKKKPIKGKPAIAYWEGTMGGIFEDDDDFPVPIMSDSEYDDDDVSHEEMQQEEMLKSEKVMIDLLQVEALWKVHKIGLNRAVKEACNLILSGEYFFFPSHQQASMHQPWMIEEDWQQQADGWVASGNSNHPSSVIDVNEGRLRAASALVLIGNVMVQASKEGTAWME